MEQKNNKTTKCERVQKEKNVTLGLGRREKGWPPVIDLIINALKSQCIDLIY